MLLQEALFRIEKTIQEKDDLVRVTSNESGVWPGAIVLEARWELSEKRGVLLRCYLYAKVKEDYRSLSFEADLGTHQLLSVTGLDAALSLTRRVRDLAASLEAEWSGPFGDDVSAPVSSCLAGSASPASAPLLDKDAAASPVLAVDSAGREIRRGTVVEMLRRTFPAGGTFVAEGVRESFGGLWIFDKGGVWAAPVSSLRVPDDLRARAEKASAEASLPERSPTSYVTKHGVLKLPPHAIDRLGLVEGGGVVVKDAMPHGVILLSNKQYLDETLGPKNESEPESNGDGLDRSAAEAPARAVDGADRATQRETLVEAFRFAPLHGE